jgi:hypothetical protein
VSLATVAPLWRPWRGGTPTRPSDNAAVAPKPNAVRASTFYGKSETQVREGERAPIGVGHVEPKLGGAPTGVAAMAAQNAPSPSSKWRLCWVERVEQGEAQLWARELE